MTTITKVDEDYLAMLKKDIDTCKVCHGTNMSCKCYREYFFEMAKINAKIPMNYRRFTLDSLDTSSIQTAIKKISKYVEKIDFYRKTGKGLYLYGKQGTGKSVVGCIVLMEAAKHGYSAYFTDIREYLDRMFGSKFQRDAEDGTQNDLLRSSEFLLIDNLGQDPLDSKGLKKSWIDDLLRYRTDNLLPTIIVTNKNEQDLTANSLRMSSILKEHFLSPIEFPGTDYRMLIRQSNGKVSSSKGGSKVRK